MLTLKNLEKQFNDLPVLTGINLEIREGEIVFILGRSGTGKSVLLKTLVGLLKADAGEIWLDGEKISDFSEEEFFAVRKKCGMVFQQPALFDSLTVFENVAFGLRRIIPPLEESELKTRVEEVLRLVHLQNINEKGPAEISFGMQKRVSLARTAALKPKVLLFDEPTTGLDPVTTNAVNRLIQELSRELKITSLVVSHDMGCALKIADRIIVLDGGKIVAQGNPKELARSEVPLVKDFLREALEEASH